jgi:hypothetical protein
MEKFCQNPLCENEAVKQVHVSVRKASDQKRALCAACEEVFTWGVQHGQMSKPGLQIDLPPKEKRPEPLYRVVYVIDVNATDVRDAAEYTHRIMTDLSSLAPVLHVLDHRGHDTIVDLAAEPPEVAVQPRSDESDQKARRFVQAGGTQCPQCQGRDLDCEKVELDELCAYQEVHCRSCQLKFFAVYHLAGYGLHIGDSFEVHTIVEDFGEIKKSAGRTPTCQKNDQDPKTV